MKQTYSPLISENTIHGHKDGQITGITRSRALAALMVAGNHSISCMGTFGGFRDTIMLIHAETLFQSFISLLFLLPLNGAIAVHFFFVLSGFVLMLAFEKHPSSPSLNAYTRFALHRIFRLWPAHLAALAFIVLALILFSHTSMLHPLCNLIHPFPYPINWHLLLNTLLAIKSDYNPVVWTLRYEFMATFYVLPLIWLTRHLSLRKALLILPLLLMLDIFKSSTLHLFDFMYMFYTGIVAARFRHHASLQRLKALSPRLTLPTLFFLSAIPRINVTIPPTGKLIVFVNFTDALISALALIILYNLRAAKPEILTLKGKIGLSLTSLGNLSYSFYLLHFMCLYICMGLLLHISSPAAFTAHPFIWQILLIITSFTTAITLACLSSRFLEKPAMIFAKKHWPESTSPQN